MIRGTDMRKPLTHARLAEFIQKDFDLTPWGIGVGDRVAIVLPNGPEVIVVALARAVPCRVSPGDERDAAITSRPRPRVRGERAARFPASRAARPSDATMRPSIVRRDRVTHTRRPVFPPPDASSRRRQAAVCVLSVAAHCTCAPINHQNTHDEIEEEMKNVGSKLVLMMQGVDNAHVEKAANAIGLPIVQLVADEEVSGVFKLEGTPTGAPSEKNYSGKRDVALVLHTSGTSGKKKVVPYTLEVCVHTVVEMSSGSALARVSGCSARGRWRRRRELSPDETRKANRLETMTTRH